MNRNCYTCAYGTHRYDSKGLIVGVECTRDNMRFLPDAHIRLFSKDCINWTEADE